MSQLGIMLFNLKSDPFEQRDIALEHPDVCMQAVYWLNDWHDHMMESMTFDVDPLWTVIQEGGPYHAKGLLPYYFKHLERTGRADAIPELKKRQPREFQQSQEGQPVFIESMSSLNSVQ